jgi:hypothetical protein
MQILFRFFALAIFLACSFPLLAESQGIQQTPYSAADVIRGGLPSIAPDFTPSNPLGLPGSSTAGLRGTDSISISSGMFQGILPKIPNLQLGYNYAFGPKFRAGTASIDYLLPFKLGAGSTIFGEAHGEFQSLSISQPGSPNNSVELCLGGGYRRMFGNHTMIGLHSFFDTTKLSGVWYSSGSVGVEGAALVAGHDAIDLNFNWYGKALDSSLFMNSLGYVPVIGEAGFGPANYDFQAGYSHEIYDGGPDFRLSVTGYKFDTAGSAVYGYYAGAELKSRDGMFVLKYDVGRDNINQTYQAVGAFMNVGFQLENLVAGKSPFEKPKPVFQSPRNITTLTEAKVNRNWRHTTQSAQLALLSVGSSCNPKCPPQTVTVVNKTGKTITLYMNFQAPYGGYTLPDSFPGWTGVPVQGYPLSLLTRSMGANDPPLVINFNCTQSQTTINISADKVPQNGCCVTQFELNLCADYGAYGGLQDTYDISLVNGFNYSGALKPDSGQTITACCQTGNKTNIGVFPYACTQCTSVAPDATCKSQTGAGSDCHAGIDENHADPPCVLNTKNPKNFTVYIGGTADGDPPCPTCTNPYYPPDTSVCKP